MKKIVAFFLLLAMTLPITACNQSTEYAESSSSVEQIQEQSQTVSSTKLTNKMTENEHQRVDKHELTLLIEPKEITNTEQTEHKVSVEFRTLSIEEWRENVESYHNQNMITDEEYETAMEEIRISAEKGENTYRLNPYIFVDGCLITYTVPNADRNYDGGLITFTYYTMEEALQRFGYYFNYV